MFHIGSLKKLWFDWEKGKILRRYFISSRNRTSGISNVYASEENKIYKFVCVVSSKTENTLALEPIYEEKFLHWFHDGHVEIESDLFYLYKLLLCSRTIEQIRLQIHSSFCTYENNFIYDMKNIDWTSYIPFSSVFVTPQINVQSIKSRLYHTCMLKNILLSVIQKQQQLFIQKNGDHNLLLKKKKLDPNKIKPTKLNVLFKYNECKIHVNVSNDLNDRIYIENRNQHSLKSTIVASAVYKIDFFKYFNATNRLFILDPFCNDGSLLLELLSILLSIPTGSPSVVYPICTFPLHSPKSFNQILNQLNIHVHQNMNQVFLLGMDESSEQIRKANRNWKRFFETMPISVNPEEERSKNKKEEQEQETNQGNQKDEVSNFKNNTLNTNVFYKIFKNSNKSKFGIQNFSSEQMKFYTMNLLQFYNIMENCIIITNIINVDKKKIKKFEKLITRSQVVGVFVFATEKYKEQTKLKFKLLLRFISNGQNIILLQLFNKRKKNVYEEEYGNEENKQYYV